MPNCIPKVLKCLHYKPNKFPQLFPHKHIPVTHNNKGYEQMINPTKHKELTSSATNRMQSVAGSFLHAARALNSSIPPRTK